MTAPRVRHLTLAVASGLALAASGCGGEEEPGALLSQSRADSLLELLDDARSQFEDGECDELDGKTLPALEEEVAGVSSDVRESFRVALDREMEDLQKLADECKPEDEPAPAPAPVPEETVAPPTTTEEVAPPPTTTEEVAPPTTEEEPPPEVEPEQDDTEDDSSGSGSGSGSGSDPGNGVVTPPGQSGGGPPSAGGASSKVPQSGGSAEEAV